MRKRWICAALLVLAMVLLTASACTSKSLIGKWQNVKETNQSLEFLKEGSIIFSNGRILVTGKYEFVGEEYIKVSFEGLSALSLIGADTMQYIIANTWQYQVSGDLMTLQILGETSNFKRVK